MGDELQTVNRVVGDNLRRSLREAGASLHSAAESAGLSYRTVRRYVSGERDMPVPVLLALLQAGNADFVRLAQRLEQEITPNPPGGLPAADAPDVAEDADGPEDEVDAADRVLQARLRRLGVTRLAARSIGPIGAADLEAVGDVVEQIVLELRQTDAAGSAQNREDRG